MLCCASLRKCWSVLGLPPKGLQRCVFVYKYACMHVCMYVSMYYMCNVCRPGYTWDSAAPTPIIAITMAVDYAMSDVVSMAMIIISSGIVHDQCLLLSLGCCRTNSSSSRLWATAATAAAAALRRRKRSRRVRNIGIVLLLVLSTGRHRHPGALTRHGGKSTQP